MDRIADDEKRAFCEKKCLLLARELVLASSAEHSLEGLFFFSDLSIINIYYCLFSLIFSGFLPFLLHIFLPHSLSLSYSLLIYYLPVRILPFLFASSGLCSVDDLALKARGYYSQESSPEAWSGEI